VVRLKDLQRHVHDVFIGIVKQRRGAKLRGPEEEMFSGSYWSAARAVEYGLIDGIADLRSKMRALHGKNVRLKAVPMDGGGLSRFRRLPGFQWP
jgi:ClpP class serine protease